MRVFMLLCSFALSACASASRPLSPSEVQQRHIADARVICAAYDIPDVDKCIDETSKIFTQFQPAKPISPHFVEDWVRAARACRTAGWEYRSPGYNDCQTNQVKEIQSARARNAAAWQAFGAGFADGLDGMSAAHGRAASRPAPITCYQFARITQCN